MKNLLYFIIGLIAAFAYRVIIVLNFFDPLWVKIAWYTGTIGFVIYFWNRYNVVQTYRQLIEENELVDTVKHLKGVSKRQREALLHIVSTLNTTKAQLNYVFIFILSAIALVVGIYLDFVV